MHTQAIPGPGGWTSGSHRREVHSRPIKFLEGCAREYGDVVRLRLGRPTYLLSGLQDLRHVLVAAPNNYQKTGVLVRYKRLFADGLLTVEAPEHRPQRHSVQPLLHRKTVSQYASDMVDLTLNTLESWEDGQPVEMRQQMMRNAVAISGKTMLGVEPGSELWGMFSDVVASHQRVVQLMRSSWNAPAWMPTRIRRVYNRLLKQLDQAAYALIERDRHGRAAGSSSVLSQLIQMQQRSGASRFTDKQLRDHALTLFVAGYEGIANTLTWACYQLSRNPECQRRVREEVRLACGDRAPEVDDLPKLPYTQMVLAETFRLYPSTWMISRQAVSADTLPSGLRIAAGDEVLISPYIVQRDARHFADPTRFDPERFSDARSENRSRYVYFPFGLGPRACVGESLAKMEGALVLATIIARCEFEPIEEAPPLESTNLFTMHPAGPVWLRAFKHGSTVEQTHAQAMGVARGGSEAYAPA